MTDREQGVVILNFLTVCMTSHRNGSVSEGGWVLHFGLTLHEAKQRALGPTVDWFLKQSPHPSFRNDVYRYNHSSLAGLSLEWCIHVSINDVQLSLTCF